MSVPADVIELVLPFKAEYVSIARLTASGIANRVGFDIETIEDIKVAIAEVCNKLVKVGGESGISYNIRFEVSENELTVVFNCGDASLKCIFDEENDELGISIITALMDRVEFCPHGSYLLSMSKSVEGNM